jgi:hypothetical protein
MDKKEKLYSNLKRLGSQNFSKESMSLSQRERDLRFAMLCNGYFLDKNGEWEFDKDYINPFIKEFEPQRISFFGPEGYENFFSSNSGETPYFAYALKQEPVINTIRKYRNTDERQAARIAFLFGGIVRQLSHKHDAEKIAKAVNFAASMTALSEQRSADAIASAISMYIVSGGSVEENLDFRRNTYAMSEAIKEDPIKPVNTQDLGLSQVARLRSFLDKIQGNSSRELPKIDDYMKALDGFPTVGAEFHFPPDAADKYPNFWKRLAILNMSQYQRGSYIQLSRKDSNVIEIRMNPSTYPVTIANWNHLRLLLPEINQAFFTATINRKEKDFSWSDDRDLLNNLRAIGMLTYAALFENSVQNTQAEINFGTVYLGQSVRANSGNYDFSGLWAGGEGSNGQMGIYAGFGDNLPHLVYYPSMVLMKPQIIESIPYDLLGKVKTLDDAFSISKYDRIAVFGTIQNRIREDERLSKANDAARRIADLLNP